MKVNLTTGQGIRPVVLKLFRFMAHKQSITFFAAHLID